MTAKPATVTITPRDLRFGRTGEQSRWWLGNDPYGTAFLNALSISFPQGEAFFIGSVRHFRYAVPEALRAEIDAFVRQEAYHTREHASFNQQVTEAGYAIAPLDRWVRDRLREMRTRHPVGQLAVTVALEHFTFIIAHVLLRDPDLLAQAPTGGATAVGLACHRGDRAQGRRLRNL